MASEISYSPYSPDLSAQAEDELLHVLRLNEVNYCWNTADPESEAYFTQLEEAFPLDDSWSSEIEERSQSFFAELDRLWPAEVPEVVSQKLAVEQPLLANLRQRFAARVPLVILETIANTAKELRSSNSSLAQRLVECVHHLALGWADEDLLVMARPLAYTMRGVGTGESEAIESILGTVRTVPFCQLTEIEKARLSLAIARYAFAQLESVT